ncbi:MAG: 1-deoxy-D-xylulose-5-phosphate synthase [Bacteroidales bacterium]
MELLDRINSPADLKKLSQPQLVQLCKELREYIVDVCSENPGHIGASLGSVELTVALHYLYNSPVDKIVWDVGHQAYTHKILTGRRKEFKNNRKYEGISGFPKMSESPHDAFGVGHASTSISAALGLAVAAQIKGEQRRVVAVIGDGAITGGLAYEGLNNAGALKRDLLIILNDNHISIDKNVGAVHNYLLKITTSHLYNETKHRVWNLIPSKKIRALFQKFIHSTKLALFGRSSLFESLGFRYFGAIDGNNLPLLLQRIEDIKQIEGPKLLHIVTKKGKGFKPAEEDQTIWHAPGLFDKESGKLIEVGAQKERYQDIFGKTLLKLAKENDKIYGITPAMPTGSSMNLLMEEMPNRVFDVGIAEQHAVTFSAGLAAAGLLPYCNIYSSFIQRAYDSVIHDVATQNLKVIFLLDRAGLVGEDGATHHGVFDIAAFRAIPNLTLFSPMDEIELRDILYSVQQPQYGATIIRYPRGSVVGLDWNNTPTKEIELGKAVQISDGSGVAVLSLGPVGNGVKEAISKVREMGREPLHYNMRFVKPIDKEALDRAIEKCKTIITVEDGAVKGGLYSAVSEYISKEHRESSIKVVGMGVPDRFIEQGTIDQLKEESHFDNHSIYQTIINEYNFLEFNQKGISLQSQNE